jgi:hypothetical protein
MCACKIAIVRRLFKVHGFIVSDKEACVRGRRERRRHSAGESMRREWIRREEKEVGHTGRAIILLSEITDGPSERRQEVSLPTLGRWQTH